LGIAVEFFGHSGQVAVVLYSWNHVEERNPRSCALGVLSDSISSGFGRFLMSTQ
jgi:hypothetical protein